MATFKLKVIKAKAEIEIDSDILPEDVYREALKLGLEVLANRKMSKITKAAYPVEAELKAAVMKAAEANIEDMKKGDIKFSTKAASKKASGAVMTEARRLAKNLVKDELKRAKIKISTVDAKEITKAANEILASEHGEAIIAQAEQNLKERDEVKITGVNIAEIVKINPEKAAKVAAKAKPKAEGQLSAKQAGMAATRQKPGKGAPQQTAH